MDGVERAARGMGMVAKESGLFITAVISDKRGKVTTFMEGEDVSIEQTLAHVLKGSEMVARLTQTIMEDGHEIH